MSDLTYVRKGFGLKAEVQDTLAADYTGQLVDMLRARDYTLHAGQTTVRLAKEFGFCYGVERAVDYAYQTRRKFPDKRIFLAGEIIHNPHVNAKLREMGVMFLAASGKGFDYTSVERPMWSSCPRLASRFRISRRCANAGVWSSIPPADRY